MRYGEGDFSNSWMEEWRWCDTLSVVEAAMLAVNLNPSELEPSTVDRLWEGRFHFIGTEHSLIKNHMRAPRFVPVFRAITRAVTAMELECEAVHLARQLPINTALSRELEEFPIDDEGVISYDLLLASNALVSANFEIPEDSNSRNYFFRLEPDWERTTVKIDKLRSWIEAKGLRPRFFFPEPSSDTDAFKDQTHDHFSAELTLAVKAWEALASTQKFPRGVKEAVSAWIDANPNAWRGEGELSNNAKDRIITLVNWKKSGGAPSTGG